MPSKFMMAEGLPEGFKDDIQVLASLTPEQLSRLRSLMIGAAGKEAGREVAASLAQSELAREIGVDKLRRVMKASSFVLTGLRQYRDSIADVVADFSSADLAVADRLSLLSDHFTDLLRTYEEEARPRSTVRSAARATLPWWKSISTSVDLRAVIPDPYRIEDNVQSYKPACTGFTPVVIVSLSVEDFEDEVASITFQADEKSLDRLLSCLIAAQVELRAAKTSLGQGILEG
jgi:hypothetical protein